MAKNLTEVRDDLYEQFTRTVDAQRDLIENEGYSPANGVVIKLGQEAKKFAKSIRKVENALKS